MREIKFRGKCTPEFPHPAVKWVYGSLVSDSKKKKKTALICVHLPVPTRDGNTFWYEVYADTVGQYTGLLDADGREIYEGDIVSWGDGTPPTPVRWDEHFAYYVIMESLILSHACKAVRVIGNVHDNPNLLEVDDARD